MKSKRGAFIVLEGCDRVGKSTQMKKLVSELKGRNFKVDYMSFPNRSTRIGQKINEILTAKNAHFDKSKLHKLFADNRREFDQWIRESLAQGTTIIADRYSFSGVAFSAANQLNKEWCWDMEKGLPKPDLVLFLRMPLEKAAERNEYGNELYEKIDFQRKVLREYENMVDSSWRTVDVDDKDINTVHLEILSQVEKAIQNARFLPLESFT